MKVLLVLFFFLCSNNIFIKNILASEEKREQILRIIDEEIIELRRLGKQTGGKNPVILIRLAERYLEKGRLKKESENYNYLALSADVRRRTNKNKFFSESNKYFIQANNICVGIIKRFPRFENISVAYYILAFNAKEFKRNSVAIKYFSLAIKKSNKNSSTYNKATLALAEIYYNEKEFKRAIPLYERSLVKKDTRWWTKDAMNLAWCYFKIHKSSQAITLAREVYSKSSSSNFIDMRHQSSRDLALFYAQSGKIDEAIVFYKQIGEDLSPRLLKLAKFLLDQGNKTSAEKVLVQAKKYSKNENEKIEVNIILITLYEKFGMFEKHIKILKELADSHQKSGLSNTHLELVKYQAKKTGAIIQKQVVGKTYQGLKKTRDDKAKLAVQYFEVLASVENTSPQQNLFLKAETLYSVNNFSEALEAYQSTYELALKRQDNKYIKLSIEGMLATLGKPGLSEASKTKYLTTAYKNYLFHYPRGKGAHSISQKLFRIFLNRKEPKEAEELLFKFKDSFPQDLKTQEAMIANIMELYRSDKNAVEIRKWVARIKNKEFKTSARFSRKIRALALTMQFEGAEKATTKGQKKEALREYFRIYKDGTSSKAARRNAAYNVAVLFFELNDTPKTFDWAMAALNLMEPKDVLKFDSTFLAMSSSMFERRQYEMSVKLSLLTLQKLCREKTLRKKVLFKNTMIIYLANDQLDETEQLISHQANCGIPDSNIKEAEIDLLKALHEKQRWNLYEKNLERLELKNVMKPMLIKPLDDLRISYLKHGDTRKANLYKERIMSYFESSKKDKLNIPLEGLDVVAEFKLEKLEHELHSLHSIVLTFPEDQFNNLLKKKLQVLDQVTIAGLDVLEVGSGIGIVKGYKYLIEAYQRVVSEINNFSPPGKSADYVKSFQASMSGLTRPILNKSLEWISEAKTQITKNSILSHDNYWFFSNKRIPIDLQYRYIKSGIAMDRGGKK